MMQCFVRLRSLKANRCVFLYLVILTLHVYVPQERKKERQKIRKGGKVGQDEGGGVSQGEVKEPKKPICFLSSFYAPQYLVSSNVRCPRHTHRLLKTEKILKVSLWSLCVYKEHTNWPLKERLLTTSTVSFPQLCNGRNIKYGWIIIPYNS